MGTELFGEIVRRAELQSITPLLMFAKRGSYSGEHPSEGELRLEEECKLSLSEDRSELTVVYHYKVDHESSEKRDSDDTFRASTAYSLVYTFDPPLCEEHDEALSTFAEHNGRFNSWPFLRAYLARVTGEFGLPPVTLPLLKPYAPKPPNARDEAKPEALE
jgi:hypothetical protein